MWNDQENLSRIKPANLALKGATLSVQFSRKNIETTPTIHNLLTSAYKDKVGFLFYCPFFFVFKSDQ